MQCENLDSAISSIKDIIDNINKKREQDHAGRTIDTVLKGITCVTKKDTRDYIIMWEFHAISHELITQLLGLGFNMTIHANESKVVIYIV